MGGWRRGAEIKRPVEMQGSCPIQQFESVARTYKPFILLTSRHAVSAAFGPMDGWMQLASSPCGTKAGHGRVDYI